MEMAQLSEEAKKKLYKTQAEYDKRSCTRINLKLHNANDADILQKLSDVENKNGYIKELIRLDIEKNLLGK